MVNPITEKGIKSCNEMIHDLSGMELTNDETIDVAIGLLHSVLLAAELKPDDYIKADLHFDGLSDAEIESIVDNNNKRADAIIKSLTEMIGDDERIAAFIRFTLDKIAAANNGDSNAG